MVLLFIKVDGPCGNCYYI